MTVEPAPDAQAGRSGRWARTGAPPARRRALTGLALAASLTALSGAALADHARHTPATLVTTVSQNARPGAVAPDCPPTGARPCTFSVADSRAVQTVLTYFRSAEVLDSYDYTPPGPASRAPALEVVRVRTSAGVVVSVTGRCIAGGGPTRDIAPTSALLGPLVVSAVDGRARGCSVAVVLVVPAKIVAPLALATALAHDERIAIAP